MGNVRSPLRQIRFLARINRGRVRELLEEASKTAVTEPGPDALAALVPKWLAAGESRTDIRQAAALLEATSTNVHRYTGLVIEAVLDGRNLPAMGDQAVEEQRLTALPAAEAFAVLAARDPRLADLEEDVRAGRLSAPASMLGPKGRLASLDDRLPPEDRAEAGRVREQYVTAKALHERIKDTIGPDSRTTDPLLGSSIASGIAARYLMGLAELV